MTSRQPGRRHLQAADPPELSALKPSTNHTERRKHANSPALTHNNEKSHIYTTISAGT